MKSDGSEEGVGVAQREITGSTPDVDMHVRRKLSVRAAGDRARIRVQSAGAMRQSLGLCIFCVTSACMCSGTCICVLALPSACKANDDDEDDADNDDADEEATLLAIGNDAAVSVRCGAYGSMSSTLKPCPFGPRTPAFPSPC